MYPVIVDWLRHGPLPWLAWLVPIPGLMHAMVLVVVGGTFIRRVRYLGFTRQQALEAALAGAVSALVFTRVFYLVTRTRFWEMPLSELANGAKGTASWGAYLGGAIGLGYVPCAGESEADVLGSTYEIEIAGQRVSAAASLAPMYDPKAERVRA